MTNLILIMVTPLLMVGAGRTFQRRHGFERPQLPPLLLPRSVRFIFSPAATTLLLVATLRPLLDTVSCC
jgi:hypothetical protein